MYSDVSEALLKQHLDNFLEEMKDSVKRMKDCSWHRSVDSSWDENHPVEISLAFSKV